MQEDGLHAERIGYLASVLAGGSAEAIEHVLVEIVATRGRYFLDRIGHVVDGDANEAGRKGSSALIYSARTRDIACEYVEPSLHYLCIQRLRAIAEDFREIVGLNATEQHVAVGHGERS